MIGRGLSLIRRHPVGSAATAAAIGVWSVIAVNAAFLQDGPHPAPLIARQGTDRVPGAVPKPRPERQAVEVAPNSFEDDARRQAREKEFKLLRDLQQALAERGFYTGSIDGLEGPLTEAAIRSYETLAGLNPTGEPSEALLAHVRLSSLDAPPLPEPSPLEQYASLALPDDEMASDATAPSLMDLDEEQAEGSAEASSIESLIATTSSIAPPDPRIVGVQKVLADLGYAPGRIDGHLGPSTREAIKQFESDRGLARTGEISERLLDELTAVSGTGPG